MGCFQSPSCEYHYDDILDLVRAWLRGKMPQSERGHYAGAKADLVRVPTGEKEEI